jgi:hypothetical protein
LKGRSAIRTDLNSRQENANYSLGLRCPPTTFISAQDIQSQIKSTTYPILVKADGSWGGKFVRIVENAIQARTTIREFQLPSNWPSTLRELLARFIPPSVLNGIRETYLQSAYSILFTALRQIEP